MAIDNLINQSQPTYFHALNPNSKIAKRSTTSELTKAAMWLVNSHTCSVCGKSFPSYQALGGHKSSHRSKSDEKQLRIFEPITGRIHECKICGKAFATGQALGGHKRKHFKGIIGAKTTKNPDDVVGGDKSGVTFDAVRVFDFDLNVSPPLEEEVESSQPPPLMLFG